MIDHVGLVVSDLALSKRFYAAALAPLGYRLLAEFGHFAGFGDARPDFWISLGSPSHGVHLALRSPDRATVDAFHRAATAAGGRDNGAPGERPHYHPGYYGAFVRDPDDNNIEAVCHEPG